MAMGEVDWATIKKHAQDLNEPIIWSLDTSKGIKEYFLLLSHNNLNWRTFLKEGQNDTEINEFESDFKGNIVEMSLSDTISSLQEKVKTYVPASGAKIIVIEFHAESPFDPNAVCKLLWDYNGADETPLWITYGSSDMPYRPVIKKSDTDGVKKLAITCDNALNTSVIMSAYAKLLVIDND